MRKKSLWLGASVMALGGMYALIMAQLGGDNPAAPMALGQTSFAQYAHDAKLWVAENRRFLTADPRGRLMEFDANVPQEYRPENPDGRGLLLIHGLGEAPGIFRELAQDLAARGILVRTVLLPGCGSKPDDLINVTTEQNLRVVDEQAAIMAREVGSLWLGGHSMGGNLAMIRAGKAPNETAGVVVFAPAVNLAPELEHAIKLAKGVSQGIVWPADRTKFPANGQSPYGYLIVPTQAIGVCDDTKIEADRVLANWEAGKDVPPGVLGVFAGDDGLVDSRAMAPRFEKAGAGVICYGDCNVKPSATTDVKDDQIPAYRIRGFSHMSTLNSPEDPVYGFHGSMRFCYNGQTKVKSLSCRAGKEIGYSGDKKQPDAVNRAVLTFNPYYAEMVNRIDAMMPKPAK